MSSVKYTVKFPLTFETDDPGHDQIGTENLPELVDFNIKNVLLTNPGERTWDDGFGVGINQYVFENFEDFELEVLENNIRSQLDEYVPYIYLNDLQFSRSIEGMSLGIRISYTIAQVNTSHVLDVTFNPDGIAGYGNLNNLESSYLNKSDALQSTIDGWWSAKTD